MPQQASGQGQPVVIKVDTAYHDAEKQPLVSIGFNDLGCAVPPEGAMQLSVRLMEAAQQALHEAHLRAFLAAQGLDQIQVIAALTSYRALVKTRMKARAERPMSVFLHAERVADGEGDAQVAFNMACPKCGAPPNAMCIQEENQ